MHINKQDVLVISVGSILVFISYTLLPPRPCIGLNYIVRFSRQSRHMFYSSFVQ